MIALILCFIPLLLLQRISAIDDAKVEIRLRFAVKALNDVDLFSKPDPFLELYYAGDDKICTHRKTSSLDNVYEGEFSEVYKLVYENEEKNDNHKLVIILWEANNPGQDRRVGIAELEWKRLFDIPPGGSITEYFSKIAANGGVGEEMSGKKPRVEIKAWIKPTHEKSTKADKILRNDSLPFIRLDTCKKPPPPPPPKEVKEEEINK